MPPRAFGRRLLRARMWPTDWIRQARCGPRAFLRQHPVSIRALDQSHFRRGLPAHPEGGIGLRSRLRDSRLAPPPTLGVCWSKVAPMMI